MIGLNDKHIGSQINQSDRHATFHALLMASLTLLALGIRLYKLGEWSFWIEEHHSLRHIAAMSSFTNVLNSVRPLFYLLVKPVLTVLGVSEWTARIVPALIGAITVPVLYMIVRKLFRPSTAFLAATLLAIAPWHIYWSQNARFYSLLLFLYTISLFSFYWGVEKDDLRYIVGSVITLALAGASHSIAALLIPIYLAYFFLLKFLPFAKPVGLRYRNLLPLFVLPLAGYFLYELYRVFIAGIIPLATLIYSQFFDESTATFIGYSNPFVMVTAVLYRTGTPLVFMTIPGAYYLLKDKKRIGLLLALGAYSPLAILVALTPFATTTSRYAFMAFPFWVILAAVSLSQIYGHAQKKKTALLWALGLPIIMFRDPASKDILYYIVHEQTFALLLALAMLIGLAGFIWFFRGQQAPENRSALGWTAGFLFILVAQPLIVDSLYFAYQGGYRGHWKEAVSLIQRDKEAADSVVASTTPLVVYYLGEDVQNIKNVNLDTVLQDDHRVWFIEEFGLERSAGRSFAEWADDHCHIAGNWDQFVAGRLWKMRVHRCTPIKPKTVG